MRRRTAPAHRPARRRGALAQAPFPRFSVDPRTRSRTPACAIRGPGPNTRCGARRALWKPMAPGEPDGQVPSRRVAEGDDAGAVDLVELGDLVDRGGGVCQRSGPATAGLADAPVLDVPGGDSPAREVMRERRHQGAIPPPLPEAPVDQDDCRPWPFTEREVKVADLIGVVAVRDLTGRRKLARRHPQASRWRRREIASSNASMSASVL